MKRVIANYASLTMLTALLLAGPGTGFAQEAKLQISHLDRLAAKAAETVDITIDESLLKLAARFLSDKRSPDEAKVKELVSGLKGVYVKSFEFDKEGEYTDADVETIRSQLRSSTWSRIVGVRNRKGENVEVFLMSDAGVIKGLTVLAAEPKELTVVNIIGPIDLEKLGQIEGLFGIPKLGLKKEAQSEKKPPADADKPRKP